MPNLTFSPLFTLTDAATNALQNAIALRNNAIWNAYMTANPNNIITPLVGGGAGIPIPANNGGVYIWGYWIECEGKKMFVPLYVGYTETNCIDYILDNILNPMGGSGSFGTMALFQNANCSDVNQLYDCLNEYNNNLIGATATTIAADMAAFFATPNAQWLRFFHNQAFYVNKTTCATCNPAAGGYHGIDGDEQFDAIYKLRNTPAGCAIGNALADEIENSRDYLAAHFCFTYMDLDTAITTIDELHPLFPYIPTNRDILLRSFRKATKKALEDISLYTMSVASGPLASPINVDLRNIQDNLVNITGAPYPIPLVIPG